MYHKALNNCDNRLCFVKNNLSLTFLSSTLGVTVEVNTVIFQPHALQTPALRLCYAHGWRVGKPAFF